MTSKAQVRGFNEFVLDLEHKVEHGEWSDGGHEDEKEEVAEEEDRNRGAYGVRYLFVT